MRCATTGGAGPRWRSTAAKVPRLRRRPSALGPAVRRGCCEGRTAASAREDENRAPIAVETPAPPEGSRRDGNEGAGATCDGREKEARGKGAKAAETSCRASEAATLRRAPAATAATQILF